MMEWHDVNIELPKEDGRYLAITHYDNIDNNFINILEFVKDGSHTNQYTLCDMDNTFYNYDSEEGYYEIDNVVYWAELPPLPSELER